MLHRQSSAAKIKAHVFIRFALMCAAFFSQNVFSQAFIRDGNFVTYKGNRFELSKPTTDTQIILDPVTGSDRTLYIAGGDIPVKMNGRPIPHAVDKYPHFKGNDKNLRAYLLKNLKNELLQLDEGEYRLFVSDVLVGENGAIVYFDGLGIYNYLSNMGIAKGKREYTYSSPYDSSKISEKIMENVRKKTSLLLDNASLYTPGELNGKKVATWTTDDYMFWTPFKIKDHKLYDKNSSNEYVPL